MVRSYMSGSQKRKLKKAQEIEAKKVKGSILKFITPPVDDSENSSASLALQDTEDKKISEEGGFIIHEKVPEEKLFISNKMTIEEYKIDDKVLEEKSIIDDKVPGNKEDCVSYNKVLEEKSIIDDKIPEQCSISTSENEMLGAEIQHEGPINDDPAEWHIITSKMIDYFLRKPPPQNMNKLKETGKKIGGCIRHVSESNFFKIKKNGEKLLREWLVLSASQKKLFCWICKLFGNKTTSLSTCGFDDWKHVAVRLAEHGNSFLHRESILKFSQRLKIEERIDSRMIKQYQSEVQHWRSILQRVVETVKFLSSRGMAFFGENETFGSSQNGNFLGCLELIAQFDPFLAKHIEKAGNQGTGHVNYLSSTIVNEFVELMGRKVLNVIIKEVLESKYFSIIVDSTPDITHIDQLCLILRYISPDHEPVERFLKFIQIFGHGAENLTNVVTSTLEELKLDIQNCRGQSYDNAHNMAGKYSGLQARIKDLNPLAEYVPCSAHSLNLVGVNAAESCNQIVNFFSLLQELYSFFSSSTYRWHIMSENLDGKQKLTLKNRSCTRWCADANATRALRRNYPYILKSLNYLANDKDQKPATRNEAKALYKKLFKLENAINTVVWDTILQRLNQTSKVLQNSMGQLGMVSPLFDGLVAFIQSVRNDFENFEAEALKILPENVTYEVKRKKATPRSRFLDDNNAPGVNLEAKDEYLFNCFYMLCDSLITNLTNRQIPYQKLQKKFSCLINLKSNFQKEEAQELIKNYPSDLDEEFPDELQQFCSLVDEKATALDMMQLLKKYNLSSAFSNVETALQIFLTLPISNCSGERSFSLLKRLKSPLRSSIQQEKLCQLSVLCLNSDITQKIDYSEAIDTFAESKIRKKTLKLK